MFLSISLLSTTSDEPQHRVTSHQPALFSTNQPTNQLHSPHYRTAILIPQHSPVHNTTLHSKTRSLKHAHNTTLHTKTRSLISSTPIRLPMSDTPWHIHNPHPIPQSTRKYQNHIHTNHLHPSLISSSPTEIPLLYIIPSSNKQTNKHRYAPSLHPSLPSNPQICLF